MDGSRHDLWFESPDAGLENETADAFLMASLLWWMERGEDVHVYGTVTRNLLRNLEEWQEAWVLWKPHRYRRISVTCDQVSNDLPATCSAIAAFSGGLDATYTVRRHTMGATRWDRAELKAGLLVHGFEIPLSDESAFEGARIRASRILDAAGLDTLTLKTNLTRLRVDWNDQFGIAVAAALTTHAPSYGVGMIGSSRPYDHMVFPWGSNPVTDHLTSSGLMKIRHDGAGANRTEKVREVSTWPEILGDLRVCFTADSRDQNCGRCEKCIRTMLNFLAIGAPVPPCFDRIATDSEIRRLQLPATGALAEEWDTIIEQAIAQGIDDSWLTAAQAARRRGRRRAAVASLPGAQAFVARVRRFGRRFRRPGPTLPL